MKVQIINKKSKLVELSSDWKRLNSLYNSKIFSCYDYIISVIDSKNYNLFILVVFDSSDRIISILPMHKKNNFLFFLNYEHSDYCEIIGQTQCLDKSFFQTIIKQNNLRGIIFNNLISPISNLNTFKSNSCSFLNLKKTKNFPSNFTHLVYRQRRRLSRILNKYNYTHQIIKYPENFPQSVINDIKNDMISRGIRPEKFMDNYMLNLIKSLYEKNILIISCVKDKRDKSVAISFVLEQDKTFYFWIDLFLNISMINIYNNISFIKEISEVKSAKFDFCRGIYNYKKQNFSPNEIDLYTSFLIKSKLISYLYNLYQNIKRKLR